MTRSIFQLLAFALQCGASDLHLSAGERPSMRIHGELRWIDGPEYTAAQVRDLIADVMNEQQRQSFKDHLELDFAVRLDDGARFRVNTFTQNRGQGAVFRAIASHVPSLASLGLPKIAQTFCDAPKGLVLVTGPTGSGKSTTLAAMVDYLNETMAGHILTLEDPIEFVHTSKRALVTQREIGSQTRSFHNALRSALREDPDVILVGELRDAETIGLALTAAETGHQVFGTLHTPSAIRAVDRMIDVFPSAQQAQVRAMLSESLVGVVAQMLVNTVDAKRAAVHEILVATPGVRNLIREGKTYQLASLVQVGGSTGMQSAEAGLADLVARGVVSLDEARATLPGSELFMVMDKGQKNQPHASAAKGGTR